MNDQKIKDIRKVASNRINTVNYLKKFPEDINSEIQHLWVQRQFLLDTIDELTNG